MNNAELKTTVAIMFIVALSIVSLCLAWQARQGDGEQHEQIQDKIAACAAIPDPEVRALCLVKISP